MGYMSDKALKKMPVGRWSTSQPYIITRYHTTPILREVVEKKLPVIFTFMLRTEAYRDAEPKSIRQMVQDPVIFANAIEDIGVLGIVKEYGVGVPKATKPDLVDLIIEHGSSPKKFKDS